MRANSANKYSYFNIGSLNCLNNRSRVYNYNNFEYKVYRKKTTQPKNYPKKNVSFS